MSRGGKPAQAKKVPPPAVPDSAFRNSGSSFGSAGYSSAGDSNFTDGYEITDGIYGMSGKSPGTFNYPAFTFPGPQQFTHVGTKSAAYYHQLSLQEDQGIDMTQSPGRDSPGSSGSGSRHSTVSLDSGRASCHMSSSHHHHHRPSLSSSSVGSGSDGSGPHKVDRLLLQGYPDQDVLQTWLMDLHFEEYFPLFVNAGYDMHTISRMTPEDLTAIGIKKPNHRKKLKAEIAQLNISDGLPDYIPGSLAEWLRLLRLEEYAGALRAQGYNTVEDTTQITWEDLEDIGIVKLGHQKRILLAIKRVQDLKAGKTFPPTPFTPTQSGEPTLECECPRVHSTFKTFHQPWEIEATRQLYPTTDIVPIKIRGVRGKSLESLEGGDVSGSSGTTTGSGGEQLRRCYEDGDVTPTNETTSYPLHQGGGTLPRPRALLRPRPQAKIAPTFNFAQPPMRGVSSSSSSSECSSTSSSSVTVVVADLHCTHPQQYNGSDASFKSSSSTESDSLPFANENAGTIKQRATRNPTGIETINNSY
ncbi:hypothetical protein AAG570_012410 [Ranatra chinensis]|uniref:SAM domain-containing protein n=1 Tax=Ranatra chinensis TaxID=642074 RepID=A0ABD0Z731_9HEMI